MYMSCHLAHKIPWDNLAESLTVYRGSVQFPIGKCGKIHCINKANKIKLQNRQKYIHEDNICHDVNCETVGLDTFSKNQIKSKEIDSNKFPLKKFKRTKLEHFCRKFTTVINEFANTATNKKEDISDDYLKNCDLIEFVDRTIPCTECYGNCRAKVCKNYVVFSLFIAGRMDILVRLHELGRVDIINALNANYGGQAVGNGYRFIVEYHLLPFYILSNIIIQCGYENDISKWASLNPQNGYSLYNRLLYDCDFKTFIPSIRHLLSGDIFMKNREATQTLLKETFRCIYQYVYLKKKFLLLENPIEPSDIFYYIQSCCKFPSKQIMTMNV